ncbi:MAG TPA: MFS transporter, partial [Kaistiaceae bacterium]|nr:MFS transporter [Kaistiaceae bacterium]
MASFATAGFARRLSFFYGALFLSIGVYLPFFPVWLSSRGLSESEIGAVLAAPLVVRILFTPISG